MVIDGESSLRESLNCRGNYAMVFLILIIASFIFSNICACITAFLDQLPLLLEVIVGSAECYTPVLAWRFFPSIRPNPAQRVRASRETRNIYSVGRELDGI